MRSLVIFILSLSLGFPSLSEPVFPSFSSERTRDQALAPVLRQFRHQSLDTSGTVSLTAGIASKSRQTESKGSIPMKRAFRAVVAVVASLCVPGSWIIPILYIPLLNAWDSYHIRKVRQGTPNVPPEVETRLQRPFSLFVSDKDNSLIRQFPAKEPIEEATLCLLSVWKRRTKNAGWAVMTAAEYAEAIRHLVEPIRKLGKRRLLNSFLLFTDGGGLVFDYERGAEPIVSLPISAEVKNKAEAIFLRLQERYQRYWLVLDGKPAFERSRDASMILRFRKDLDGTSELAAIKTRVREDFRAAFDADPALRHLKLEIGSGPYVDIYEVDKADALRRAVSLQAQRLGQSEEHVWSRTLAMGDGLNDVVMLNEAAAQGGLAIWLGGEASTLHPDVCRVGKGYLGGRAVLAAHVAWLIQTQSLRARLGRILSYLSMRIHPKTNPHTLSAT